MAARLRLSATRLARRLRSESVAGLSPSQLSALATIHLHGPLMLGELAEREGVSPPTITKVVGRLEVQQFVRRTTDSTDRRICRVESTEEGAGYLQSSRERKNAWLAARIASIDRDGQDRLAAALDVLEELAASGDVP